MLIGTRSRRKSARSRNVNRLPFWLWDDIVAKTLSMLRDAQSAEGLEKSPALPRQWSCWQTLHPDARWAASCSKTTADMLYSHPVQVGVLAAVVSKASRVEPGTAQRPDSGGIDHEHRDDRPADFLVQQQDPLDGSTFRSKSASTQGCGILEAQGLKTRSGLKLYACITKSFVALGRQQTPGRAGDVAIDPGAGRFGAKVSPRTYRNAIQAPVAAKKFVQGAKLVRYSSMP